MGVHVNHCGIDDSSYTIGRQTEKENDVGYKKRQELQKRHCSLKRQQQQSDSKSNQQKVEIKCIFYSVIK